MKWLERFPILSGIITGAITFVFVFLFHQILFAGTSIIQSLSIQIPWILILMPMLAAFYTYLVYKYYLDMDKTGLGVGQALIEIRHIHSYLMRPKRVLLQLGGVLSALMAGLPVGRFGVFVHIGASVGSFLGYQGKLNPNTVRLLIGCGAAAGISGIFGWPFFAAVFVMEVLLHDRYKAHFAPVLFASMTSYLLSSKTKSILPITTGVKAIAGSIDLSPLWVVILGLSCGMAAILYIRSLEWGAALFKRWNQPLIELTLVGIFIGLINIYPPLRLDMYSSNTGQIIGGDFTFLLMAFLFIERMISTSASLGSGFMGSNFFPGLTLGAMVGGMINHLQVMLGGNSQPETYAIIGMGSMVAGFLGAPISGIALIFELGQVHETLLASLITCGISAYLVSSVLGRNIYSRTVTRLSQNWTKQDLAKDKEI